VWRRIKVSSGLSLSVFHDKILCPCFGWVRNYHAYAFTEQQHGAMFGPVNSNAIDMMHLPTNGFVLMDDTRFYIGDVLRLEGDTLLYNYDFGDNFDHEIRLVEIKSAKESNGKVLVIDGAMAPLPEDSVGSPGFKGPSGFQCLLDSWSNQSSKKKLKLQATIAEALNYGSRPPFDPYTFSPNQCQEEVLQTLQTRASLPNHSKVVLFPTQPNISVKPGVTKRGSVKEVVKPMGNGLSFIKETSKPSLLAEMSHSLSLPSSKLPKRSADAAFSSTLPPALAAENGTTQKIIQFLSMKKDAALTSGDVQLLTDLLSGSQTKATIDTLNAALKSGSNEAFSARLDALSGTTPAALRKPRPSKVRITKKPMQYLGTGYSSRPKSQSSQSARSIPSMSFKVGIAAEKKPKLADPEPHDTAAPVPSDEISGAAQTILEALESDTLPPPLPFGNINPLPNPYLAEMKSVSVSPSKHTSSQTAKPLPAGGTAAKPVAPSFVPKAVQPETSPQNTSVAPKPAIAPSLARKSPERPVPSFGFAAIPSSTKPASFTPVKIQSAGSTLGKPVSGGVSHTTAASIISESIDAANKRYQPTTHL
ncbi:hypothetical protein HDU91_004824, partial [Kappamyces sp. JEL0680]